MKYQIAETQAEKILCYQLRAQEYGRRYHNIPKDLYQDELDQAYLLNGQPQAYTLFVAENGEILGTVRLAFAYDTRFPDLDCETTHLVKLESGLGAQFIQITTPTVTLSIGEIGKLTVSQDIGTRNKEVLVALLHGLATVAHSLGINVLIGVVAPYVARAVRNVGGRVYPASNLSLNRDTYEQLAFLVRYHEYFLPKLAANHPEVQTVNFVEGKTLDELVKITAPYPDGAQLYWNWTEDFMKSLTLTQSEI